MIGVGAYDHSDRLPPIPAAARNLIDLNWLLTGEGGVVRTENCWTVLDPAGSAEVGDLVERSAEQAGDMLLVYYTGHGLLDRRGRLHLTLTGTHPDRAGYTALPFTTLRESILDSPATTRILILDCCFSGRAFDALSDGPDAILGQADIAGTYTITSSARNETSYAPPGHRNTAFTGALLAAATSTPGLVLDDLYTHTRQHLRRHGHPQPQRRAVDTAGRVVLFPHSPSSRSVDERGRPSTPRRADRHPPQRTLHPSVIAPNTLTTQFEASHLPLIEPPTFTTSLPPGNYWDEPVKARRNLLRVGVVGAIAILPIVLVLIMSFGFPFSTDTHKDAPTTITPAETRLTTTSDPAPDPPVFPVPLSTTTTPFIVF
nr:caspase family protein [Nocardia bovistercoris]